MLPRFRRVAFLLIFLAFTFYAVIYFEHIFNWGINRPGTPLSDYGPQNPEILLPLTCSINGHLSSGCYSLNNSAYLVDLKHITYWYEAEGSLNASNPSVLLISSSSDPAPHSLKLGRHEPLGYYMGQDGWSKPENKNHILLVDAQHNVPISRQWDPKGYPYPIQISQFGLSYFMLHNNLQKLAAKHHLFHNDSDQTVVDVMRAFAEDLTHTSNGSQCQFEESGGTLRYDLANDEKRSPGLSSLIITGTNWPEGTRVVIEALLLPPAPPRQVQIHFACSSDFGSGQVVLKNAYWGLGHAPGVDLKVVLFLNSCTNVSILQDASSVIMKAISGIVRDASARRLFDDIQMPNHTEQSAVLIKSIELSYTPRSLSSMEPVGILKEFLLFAPLKQSPTKAEVLSARQLGANIRFAWGRFTAAARWLLANQAPDGAWPVPARHNFTQDIYLEPGWCSAMGQGQGISLLVRAASVTAATEIETETEAEAEAYLRAALSALGPFRRSVGTASAEAGARVCGVRAHFLGQSALPWYEEYPVTPSVFVLNGFVFSLIGLFDLTKAPGLNASEVGEAQRLLNEGISTLVRVLPLFDSGAGSFYDLRHLSLAHSLRLSSRIPRWDPRDLRPLLKSGPNRARWQYHRVHLEQLHQLTNVVAPQHATLWNLFFDRWMAYSWGFRSGHN